MWHGTRTSDTATPCSRNQMVTLLHACAHGAVVFFVQPEGASCTMQRMDKKRAEIDESQRKDLHESFNNRISSLCKLAALVISVVVFTTVILGQEIESFVILGLSLSVALLAIASLQDSNHKNKR